MLFNSLIFFALLLPTLIIYWLVPWQKTRLLTLLIASLVFYGYYHWPSVFLLLFTISFNYVIGILLDNRRSLLLVLMAVAVNLSILLWFKYAVFIAENINTIIGFTSLNLSIPVPPLFLPLGISFFTFQVVAYQIDIYHKEIEPERSFLRFAVFKCFFPQLIAGPIVRAKDFLPQLRQRLDFDAAGFHQGLWLILVGLSLKIGVADVLAQFANDAFKAPEKLTTVGAWTGLYAYAFQLYGDFWGYSTMAVGLAALFGLKLPLNFDTPYSAVSIQGFWRRWHITLSVWFRDYVYIPLGGNRHRHVLNLIITMGIAGLWHGAGWNFIIWGIGHGIWLALESHIKINNKSFVENRFIRFLRMFLVFHGVCILWVFFRSPTVAEASIYLSRLLVPPFSSSSVPEVLRNWLLIFALIQLPIAKTLTNNNFTQFSMQKQWALGAAACLWILAYAGAKVDFIYFTF